MKKLRKMLGQADSDYIIELMNLIDTQSKDTIAKWVLDYSEKVILPIYLKYYPDDNRPKMAIDASRDWFLGKKKLPEVKNIILNECHAAAREHDDNPIAQAAARAIGQASATFHTPSHSLGLAFYGAAALAYENIGLDADDKTYDDFARKEVNKMIKALKDIAVENEPNKVKIKWYC
jgi:hypothetical protein